MRTLPQKWKHVGERFELLLCGVVAHDACGNDQGAVRSGPADLRQPQQQLVEVIGVVAGELRDDLVEFPADDFHGQPEALLDHGGDGVLSRPTREFGRRVERVVYVKKDR